MMNFLWLALIVSIPMFIQSAQAQEVITVNQTEPCFLNYTAGADLWRNCGIDEDYLQFSLLPWEWITGGNFSLVIVAIFTMFTYIKYHKVIYPILIGVMFLPLSFFVFPDAFLSFAMLMSGVAIGILIWYIYIRQTKEYA